MSVYYNRCRTLGSVPVCVHPSVATDLCDRVIIFSDVDEEEFGENVFGEHGVDETEPEV